jgi:hypothetical protein
MTKKPQKENEIELYPDAWDRFERAAKVVVKSPPQHRVAKKKLRKAPKKKKD